MPILALKALKNWKGKWRGQEEEEEAEKVPAPEPLVKPLTEPKYKVSIVRDKELDNVELKMLKILQASECKHDCLVLNTIVHRYVLILKYKYYDVLHAFNPKLN